MTTEQKIEKLIDYSNFYNSNMKLLEFNCPEKFYLSNSNDGKDSNSVSVEVESYEEANQIYGTLVFKLG